MRRILVSISFVFFYFLSFAEHSALLNEAFFDHLENAPSREIYTLSELESQDVGVDSVLKLVNNTKYAVALWGTKIKKDSAYFDALLSVKLPEDGQRLDFYARHISFSNSGGIKGRTKLYLAKDVTYLKGDGIRIVFKANQCFAEIDCNGFVKMGLGADVEFSRDYLIPELPDGTLDPVNRLRSNFYVEASDMNDILVKIDLDPFQLKGLKDFTFHVHDVILDMSDYSNPPVVFPSWYTKNGDLSPIPELWRGVYMAKGAVTLPHYAKNENNERIQVGVADFLYDSKGFSGEVFGAGLLSLDKGRIGGDWACSIRKLDLKILRNQLVEGDMLGQLVMPITKSTDTLSYKATIGLNGTTSFLVSLNNKIQIPVLQAKEIVLTPNSYVEIKLEDKKVFTKAYLNGEFNFETSLSGSDESNKASFKKITFQGLQLANTSPHLQIEALSYGANPDKQSLSNFPINIRSIGVRSVGNDLYLGIGLAVNINEKFSGEAGLSIHSEIKKVNGKTSFQLKDIGIDSIKINAELTKIHLIGALYFFKNDPVYGKGINGSLTMSIEMSGGSPLIVSAGALFGSVNGMRYWNADASVSGFTLPLGYINITGFAGGAFYHLKKVSSAPSIGRSQSGQCFVPDPTAGLGLMAGVQFNVMRENVVQANAMFQICFNTEGGLRSITFMASGQFFSPAAGATTNAMNDMVLNFNKKFNTETSDASKNDMAVLDKFKLTGNSEVRNILNSGNGLPPSFKANIIIDYNFDDDIFKANMQVYVNAAGILKGVNAEDLAGEGEVYISKSKWHVFVGTPTQKVGLDLLGLAQTGSYFMVGTDIPSSPDPPAIVMSLLNLTAEDLNAGRKTSDLNSGKGIAFGANLTIDTGDKSFLMFYARMQAGLGFDVSIRDYGTSAHCEGRKGPIGMNGWYAMGSSYAYFNGNIGIRVNLKFIKGNYEILNVGAAVLLQAKLPNPFYFVGYVGGKYSILGGAVSGRCNFKMEIGEQCKVVTGGTVGDIEIISELTPKNNDKDVSVFNKPQVIFNVPIDKVFHIENENGNTEQYRATVDNFGVSYAGIAIAGENEWNEDHTVLAFRSLEVLPGNKEVKVQIKLKFEKLINNTWVLYGGESGIPYEIKSTTFKTGPAPDYIPLDNIQYTYPLMNQLNFHDKASSTGYIQLIRGQKYLFEESSTHDFVIKYISSTATTNTPLSYNDSKLRVQFPIPDLAKSAFYQAILAKRPKVTSQKIDQNVYADAKKTDLTEDSYVVEKKNKSLGNLEDTHDKEFLKYKFKTSTYASPQEKWTTGLSYMNSFMNTVDGTSTVHVGNNYRGKELLDKAEIDGINNAEPLYVFKLDQKNNAWFQSKVKPMLYSSYPFKGKFFFNRDTTILGYQAEKAMYVVEYPEHDHPTLTDEIEENGTVSYLYDFFKVITGVESEIRKDHYHVLLQVINSSVASTSEFSSFIEWDFPSIPVQRGVEYNVNLYYRLPGEKNLQFVKKLVIKF